MLQQAGNDSSQHAEAPPEQRKLTAAEKRVLAVLCDPAYFGLPNREKFTAAQVSERQYYRIMGDPGFQQHQKDMVFKIIQGDVAGVIGAALESAQLPGRDGHYDRKMLLEMAGTYAPPVRRQELTGKDGGPLQVDGVGLSGLLKAAQSKGKADAADG